jgi:hypothetical protein
LGDPVDVLVDQANLEILEIRLSLVKKAGSKRANKMRK